MMQNNKLTKNQKEAVGLLSIGTFLEYFDLMLYVHMAVLLNDLFFPQSNPTTAKLLGITAFCMTFAFRPVGGFIIGRIGDIMGRKYTIMLTSFIMAFTCLTMALIPTYTEIGIVATAVIMICRAFQGISSLGEGMGALIYTTEALRPPYRYVAIGVIDIASVSGGLFALLIAFLASSSTYGWRVAFFVGAIVAFVGVIARSRLRETADFMNYKKRIKDKSVDSNLVKSNTNWHNTVDKKNMIGIFFSIFNVPLSFYVSYIYIGDFMVEKLGMKPEQVMLHNLILTLACIFSMCIFTYLCKRYHPIRLLKITYTFTAAAALLLPYCLENIIISTEHISILFCLQFVLYAHAGTFFNEAIYLRSIPIKSRFTTIGTMFGVCTAIAYIVNSYGLPFLTMRYGYYGVWIIYTPAIIGFFMGIQYLKKLEIKRGAYHSYPHEDPPNEDTAVQKEDDDYEDLGDEYEPFRSQCEYSSELLNQLEIIAKEENNKLNIKLIKKAIVFAKKWHDGQMRKTGDKPFYSHPLYVAGMVAKYMPKTDVIIAAILHDVVEDSECTVELIEKKFNKRIAQIVDRLTKVRIENSKQIKLSFAETLDRLQKINDNEALFIKEMDRMHNLETIDGLNPEKQKKMAKETNSYLVSLVAIIGDKLNIYGKIYLENKIFKYCYDVLKKWA